MFLALCRKTSGLYRNCSARSGAISGRSPRGTGRIERFDVWVDHWTGQTYRGEEKIVADAPLDRIPILVKEGSFVLLGPIMQSVSEPQDPLEIRIYAGKDADFQLYEDSGDGYAYEHGARAPIHLHWDDHRNALSLGTGLDHFPGCK